MFELDDGLEEFGDAAGEIAEEEIEDAVDDVAEEFDSDNLLMHWNRKESAVTTARRGSTRAKPVHRGPTIKEILTRLESQLKNQFGERAEVLEVPLDRARLTLRELFPPLSKPGPSEEQHKQLQKDLHRALNQIEDIMDSLVVSTQAEAK